uniref:Small ribosomal subunit protein mS26 n=1 Tax=Phallusia mammillata TaxID=59560 RepID=A0A6F9DKN6_9ASCI|nr:28S ribosomal protein S26, mitochondrial-like [Phallusia mammillata]
MTAPCKEILCNKLVSYHSAIAASKCMQHPNYMKQQVRYRKPRSLGRAPTKKADPSYFKKSYPTPEDEKHAEPIYLAYNSAMVSIVAAFQEELLEQQQNETVTEKEEELSWNEETHHKKCMDYIMEVNANLQNARSKRLVADKQSVIQMKNDMFDPTQIKKKEFAAKLAVAEQEAANWITLENCEEKVVEAIDFPINVNFAVDNRGFVLKRTAQELNKETM